LEREPGGEGWRGGGDGVIQGRLEAEGICERRRLTSPASMRVYLVPVTWRRRSW
jgi:hypothetical protein